MPSKVCPKTCSQLSTAAVFISIGVVQLLAGIILLKSEHVYLLAGIDFVAAASNILVGSSLGISSSVWENKKKQITTKSTARQNVLAGLYISVMVVNITTAVVMIMGEGNKLLTVSEEASQNTSAVFVSEILACAYVASVCSPIVCIVVALVCLSGNRIQIHENGKEKESISKTESFGWVFKNNHAKGPKLSDVISPPNKNSTVSDDNVFSDKKSYVGKRSFIGKKVAKNLNSRSTVSSARELRSPLEIWAHKRRKILQDITSPNKFFFPDDYLQFPDFSYGSYVETILPRIKQTSLLDPRDRMNVQRTQVASLECSKDNIAKVNETSRVTLESQSDEMKAKLIARPRRYSDSISLSEGNLNETNPLKENTRETHDGSSNATSQLLIDTPDSAKSKYYSVQRKTQCNRNQSSHESLKQQILQEHCVDDSKSAQSFLENYNRSDTISKTRIMKQKPTFADVFIDDIRDTENKEVLGARRSTVSDFKAETINELKSKFDKIRHDARSAFEEGKEFMKSFKNGGVRKSKWSESDLHDKPSFLGNSTERTVFSESSENDPTMTRTSWAGEVVPISLRTATVNRSNSIPVSTVGSWTSNYHSPSIEDKTPERLDENTSEKNVAHFPISGRVQSHKRSMSLYAKNNNQQMKKSVFEYPKMSSIKKSEKKRNIFDRISSMGSIAESPTEEIIQNNEQFSNSHTSEHELPVVSADVDNTQCSETNTDGTLPSISPKHCELKATPSTNILKRLWSFTGTKADLSNLIMDVDSLVGLSDEELMARTHRLRLLRKSVIMRSRNENNQSE